MNTQIYRTALKKKKHIFKRIKGWSTSLNAKVFMPLWRWLTLKLNYILTFGSTKNNTQTASSLRSQQDDRRQTESAEREVQRLGLSGLQAGQASAGLCPLSLLGQEGLSRTWSRSGSLSGDLLLKSHSLRDKQSEVQRCVQYSTLVSAAAVTDNHLNSALRF